MAFFDPTTDTLILRLVYDGMGTAGKTTNIDRICEQFSAAREGDVYTPEVVRGRTLYFDWLELHAGRLEGRWLRCQVVTVPGQFAFAQRRWELLRSPDAIVAVCDSSAAALTRSQAGLAMLGRSLAARGLQGCPVVVQANKQDLPGALPPDELARRLHLDAAHPVIPASAATGEGVRKTLMTAIHAAIEPLRALLQEGGVAALPRLTESPEELYERMKNDEDGDEMQDGAILADAVIGALPMAGPEGKQHDDR
jgi:signal recognition particle receptor subunit beta